MMKYLVILFLLLFNLLVHAEEAWESFFDGTKTVHLQFEGVINDQYKVDVLWSPDDENTPVLSGSAIIRFSYNSGGHFSVSADSFHITKNLGLFQTDESCEFICTKPVDISKVYSVRYDELGKVSFFDNSHQEKTNPPFFFEDIDFDGKDELIITDYRAGQRGVDSYTVYKDDYKNGNKYNLAVNEPFNVIDSLTTFNKEHKTIDVYKSGGACNNSNDKYKLIDGKYKFVEFTKWNSKPSIKYGYICTESIYAIVNNEKVIKSKSESYWDSDKAKYIKLGASYH